MPRYLNFNICESVAVDVTTSRLSYLALLERLVGASAQMQRQGSEEAPEQVYWVNPVVFVSEFWTAEDSDEERIVELRVRIKYEGDEEGRVVAGPITVRMTSPRQRLIAHSISLALRRLGVYAFILETRRSETDEWRPQAQYPIELIPTPVTASPPVMQSFPDDATMPL